MEKQSMRGPVTRLQKSTMQEDTVKESLKSHHLQGVSNGALFLLQTPNSGVLAFGHSGCNTTTPATSEPWPPKSCLVCGSPHYL